MIVITRLKPDGDPKKLWNFLSKEMESNRYKFTPLYLTHSHNREDISLVTETDDIEEVHRFVLEKIVPMESLRGMWIFNLITPHFYDVPDDLSPALQRFTITIQVRPEFYTAVFENLKNLNTGKGIIPTFVAFTHHNYGNDLILSLLGNNINTVEKFLTNRIRPMNGVSDISVISVETKMLKANFSLVSEVIVSGCGIVCSDCIRKSTGKCPGCLVDNGELQGCAIIQCLAEKNLKYCLACNRRLVCQKMKESMMSCPLEHMREYSLHFR